MKFAVLGLVSVLVLIGCGRSDASPLSEKNRYIIRLEDDADVSLFVEGLASKIEFDLLNQYKHVFKGFAARLSDDAVQKLTALDSVDYVERDGILTISQAQIPWGLDRIDQLGLPLDDSYTPIGSGQGVNVYVLDTGIQATHNDFGGRASSVYDATDGDGVDCNGHGTHTAAVVGGTAWGVAKDTLINSVRVFGCSGSGYSADVIEACDWVAANGATSSVVSLSFSGSAMTSVDDAVDRLIAAGFVVVTAAGNDISNACSYSPGRTADSITVAAIDNQDEKSYFSNFGSCVDIFAPGEDIESAWIGDDTDSKKLSGTSVAVPHVAGAAAILLELDESLTPAEVKSALIDRAVQDAVQNPGEGSPNRILYVGSGDGPNYPPAVPDCSFIITVNNTDITSPNYPQDYGFNEDCDWTITADEGYYVLLTFDRFDLEDGNEIGDCVYDYLNAYDGTTSNDLNKIASLCGRAGIDPGSINSTGPNMFLKFVTDADQNERGFRGTVSFIEVPATTYPPATGTCSCEDTCEDNIIQSPNFPAEYDNNADCNYQFSVPGSYQVNVTFLSFTLESSSTCNWDKVVIYDGTDNTGEELAELCGPALPEPVITTGSDVYIEFITDGSVTYPGFQAVLTGNLRRRFGE